MITHTHLPYGWAGEKTFSFPGQGHLAGQDILNWINSNIATHNVRWSRTWSQATFQFRKQSDFCLFLLKWGDKAD